MIVEETNAPHLVAPGEHVMLSNNGDYQVRVCKATTDYKECRTFCTIEAPSVRFHGDDDATTIEINGFVASIDGQIYHAIRLFLLCKP